MNRIRLFVTIIVALHFGGMISALLSQTPNQGIEQQLRSEYPVKSAGADGAVVRSVLVVRLEGIKAVPSPAIWPCNTYTQGSGITHGKTCELNYSLSKSRTRPLKIGEKAYLTAIQYKPPEVVFKVQTIPGDATEAPFGAAISFEFKKGAYVSFSTIQEWIGDVFTLAPPVETPKPPPEKPTQPRDDGRKNPPPSLPLPSTCLNAQTPADQLQLNADNSFSLREAGETYRGTFTINGDRVEINIPDIPKTTMTIKGTSLTDASGQTWTCGSSTARPGPTGSTLRNEDIIKLAKVGIDDATIIAKIGSSSCEFDTSTDALIQLKQSGVSAKFAT